MSNLKCYNCRSSIKLKSNEKNKVTCFPEKKIYTENTKYFPKCFTLTLARGPTNIFICSPKCQNKIIGTEKERHLRTLEKIGFISPM